MTWNPDTVEPDPTPRAIKETFALEDLDDGRCKASTWRGPVPALRPHYESYFGPGGYNRCIGAEGHPNHLHKDEWGHVFAQADGRTRVVRTEQPEEARV